MAKRILQTFLILVILSLTGLFSAFLINRHIHSFADDRLENSMTEIPVESPPRVAVVFGAKVWDNNELSPVLYDRVVTAVELRRAGRVKKLLMSGDNRFENYDEPTAMKQAAIKLGVPEADIVLDFAGRRTYDTCRRAKEIFGVERAILVTQEFHLPRALYLCGNSGVESVGITADRRKYEAINLWKFREFFARAGAWFEVNFFQLTPVGGEEQPIRQ